MATVPVTRTWVAGEVVTAGYMNNNVTAPVGWLLAPALCQVRQIVTQSVATGAWTPVTFTAEDVDTTGMHSTSSNTDRLTAVYPGWYGAAGGTPWATNSSGIRGNRWTVNGTAVNAGAGITAPSSSNVHSFAKTMLLFLNVGDILRMEAFQNGAASLGTVVVAESQSSATVWWVSN